MDQGMGQNQVDRVMTSHNNTDNSVSFSGYDIEDVPLGDLLRGERATLGKSLLDVERELRIRATYISAIENGDLSAFSSPAFVVGYVKSYARCLGMDPEWTFQRFCAETGFQGVHGLAMGKPATVSHTKVDDAQHRFDYGGIQPSSIVLTPSRENVFSIVEPGKLGSIAVLIALVVGIGYGAWAVLHDIQRLQIAPVDDAPAPLAQLDPLVGAAQDAFEGAGQQAFDITAPRVETLDRLNRPQALDMPVLTPRDSALAMLDPDEVGALGAVQASVSGQSNASQNTFGLRDTRAVDIPQREVVDTQTSVRTTSTTPVQVTETATAEDIVIFAVRPSWVRVTSAGGTVLFQETLNTGDSYVVPYSEEPAILRTGNAGSVYLAVDGLPMGPVGQGTSIEDNVILAADAIFANHAMADLSADPDLPEVAALVFRAESDQ